MARVPLPTIDRGEEGNEGRKEEGREEGMEGEEFTEEREKEEVERWGNVGRDLHIYGLMIKASLKGSRLCVNSVTCSKIQNHGDNKKIVVARVGREMEEQTRQCERFRE